MVLDTARPKYKENTTWLGMCGRDAARKLTLKVDILQVFTIDFSEIQYIVNHNSQSDGQNRSAKGWTNLQKKTTLFISLQRKRKDTKDNGILPRTKQAKMGLWSFDLIFEPLSWWKIAYTTNQENQVEERLHPDQHWRWHSSSSTSWWDKSEWTWKWAHKFFKWFKSLFVTVGFVYGR